jgi:hypothetical protein
VRFLERHKRNVRIVRRRNEVLLQIRSIRFTGNLTNYRNQIDVSVEMVEYLDGDVALPGREIVVVVNGASKVKNHMLDNLTQIGIAWDILSIAHVNSLSSNHGRDG